MYITFTQHQLAIARSPLTAPLLVQQARPHHRPYIHPILAPDGRGVLTEDAPPHHPWQHGLYVGLNDVNGVGFCGHTAAASVEPQWLTFASQSEESTL